MKEQETPITIEKLVKRLNMIALKTLKKKGIGLEEIQIICRINKNPLMYFAGTPSQRNIGGSSVKDIERDYSALMRRVKMRCKEYSLTVKDIEWSLTCAIEIEGCITKS